ncbi:hypothetical protein ABTZ44_07585 [Microbacterium oxydans]|uniref:hypothetical protein n=1 Tax=Microbacterium oxydans TaxID=82380 RepID=UPI00331A0256|nr:hypothetical protein [Microbacterium oxydans]
MTVRIDEHGCLIVGNCALPAAVVPAVEAFYREQFEHGGVVAEEPENRAPVQASRGLLFTGRPPRT